MPVADGAPVWLIVTVRPTASGARWCNRQAALTALPGVSETVARVIISEVGTDMTPPVRAI